MIKPNILMLRDVGFIRSSFKRPPETPIGHPKERLLIQYDKDYVVAYLATVLCSLFPIPNEQLIELIDKARELLSEQKQDDNKAR